MPAENFYRELKAFAILFGVVVVGSLAIFVYENRQQLFQQSIGNDDPVSLTSEVASTPATSSAEPQQPFFAEENEQEIANSRVAGANDDNNSDPEDRYRFDILVDKRNALPANYIPPDLVSLDNYQVNTEGKSVQLRKKAATALEEMNADLSSQGYSVVVISGFRSYQEQRSVHQSWVNKLGAEEASFTSARAGHSEHQLGTTVDITLPNRGGELSSIYPGEPSPAWDWLDKNAHKYGFVMSYRYGQESQTGYNFEPWHWRYVGIRLATEIRLSSNTPQSFYTAL
jgi:LAS superfamily LD-carboxypeptidase LdcB